MFTENTTKFAGADWIKSALKKEMSPLGESVADILGELFLGIYHLESVQLKKVNWTERDNLDVVLGYRSFSTYDDERLTRLVFLAHHRAIRVEIYPHSFKYLRLVFSKRSRLGAKHERHPTLDQAVATFMGHVSLPEA